MVCWAWEPQPCGARRPRRVSAALPLLDDITTSPASRRLASACPALAPKCQLILARTLRRNMVDKDRTSSSQTAHPLIETALASKAPIAELIGFTFEEIGNGRAVGSLHSGPQH